MFTSGSAIAIAASSGRHRDEHGDDVEVALDGTIERPRRRRRRRGRSTPRPTTPSRLRGTVAAPTFALVDAAGALSDRGGSLLTVSGSKTFAGATDAALVWLAP